MANIGELCEDWRGNEARVPLGNTVRRSEDRYQRNLAMLRLANGKEHTYAEIAHKLGITLDIVKNVVRAVKQDKVIPGEYKNSTKITEEQLVDIKLMVAERCAVQVNLTPYSNSFTTLHNRD